MAKVTGPILEEDHLR